MSVQDHRSSGAGGSALRPLPNPSDPIRPAHPATTGRRSLPRPPSTPIAEQLPPSRSGRALPPVPMLSTTAPSPSDAVRRPSQLDPTLVEAHNAKTSTTGTSGDRWIDGTQAKDHYTFDRQPMHRWTDAGAWHESPLGSSPRTPYDYQSSQPINGTNGSSGQEIVYTDFEQENGAKDGRGTPTQMSWLQERQDHLRPQPILTGTEALLGLASLRSSVADVNTTLRVNGLGQSVPASITAKLDSGVSSRESLSEIRESGWSDRVYFPDAHPHRQSSTRSSLRPSIASASRPSTELSPSWAEQPQAPSAWVERKLQIHQSHRTDIYDDESMFRPDSQYDEEDDWDGEEEAEVDESRFFNRALLSEMALQVKDKVAKSRHTKAGIAWVGSFTGKDIVTSIQGLLPTYTRDATNDRRYALISAHSLQNQLWFVEVDWDIKPLRDSAEDVFRFMGEMEGMGSGDALTGELPKGVLTMATRCYSPSCTEDRRCYSPRCPYRTHPDSFLGRRNPTPPPTTTRSSGGKWSDAVDPLVLHELSEPQKRRQTVIHQAIQSEMQYEGDLAAIERFYIEGLRDAVPQVITPAHRREEFIQEVFSNTLAIREATRRLIENFAIRQREQPIILTVGDIFLEAAADFHDIYPEYTGNLPHAEQVLSQELAENPELRLFVERVVRENDRRRDINHLIARPKAQLQRYPPILDAILQYTDPYEVDREFLAEALASIQSLSTISQLKLFQASRGRGPAGKLQWYDLVSEEHRQTMDKKEQKRQMQIWELIQGEMEYVADLGTIETLFVDGLRQADVPIIERSRLEIFLDDAFHNYRSLLEVHSDLLEKLHDRQAKQHPQFGMVSDLLLDAALNWQDAYMEYVTHYPIAKAKVQEEQQKNTRFASFLEACLKNPLSQRQDIYHFINRPIPRLLRYNLLLADILKSTGDAGHANHPDLDTIPQAMEIIGDLGKATQKGVAVNESKVELWTFQNSLDGTKFGPRSIKDLDLLDPTRELIHRGKVWRQPEGAISMVLAKPEKLSKTSRREGNQLRFSVNRRPIPLELLNLGNFSDAPRARSGKTLFGTSNKDENDGPSEAPSDSRTVWPFTISFIGQGQLGGQYTLWADSYAARADWQEKLQHAKVLRNEINDAGKVFEMTPLSLDTFYMAPNYAAPRSEGETPFTGRVTCSCPFEVTIDGRSLVAVGCEEGVWIGLRHDPRSLRKVLHVKAVTNIAVLEEFGIFLVLQDKSLLAYHLEALVPSNASQQVRAAPQRLSPGKDIAFFTVGQLSGRTLVLYMKKKGMDSLFRVLEPILGRNVEDRQRRPFGPLFGQRTEWFRLYKDFFIPTEALNVHFLKHKLAVVCAKGFEIMDLTDLKGGSIPVFDPQKTRDRPVLAELQRKCDTSKPLAMFRSTETEFILCYDSFGIYVDRHGEPNRDCQAIEWEGRPDSVAFHPPYLLLISAPFVEVRHIDNAKLLQIYTGSDIHLTWDGTGGMARPFVDNPGPKGYGEEANSQEPRIHICQRPEDTKRSKIASQGIGQHVYELVPTLLLNNPIINPVHTHDSNYFPPAPPMSHRASSIITASSEAFGSTFSADNFAGHPDQNWDYVRGSTRWEH